MATIRKYKQWTKDELKSFLTLWEEKTAEELAKEFGVESGTISHIAMQFRKEGVELTRKRTKGSIRSLIREVISETGKKK